MQVDSRLQPAGMIRGSERLHLFLQLRSTGDSSQGECDKPSLQLLPYWTTEQIALQRSERLRIFHF